MKRLDQTGSHVVGIMLLVLVLGFIGFAGYKVMNTNKTATNKLSATAPATTPAAIQNTADLTQAASALDSSSAQVNSGLDASQLDSSLNDML
jgi:hypothetical protein